MVIRLLTGCALIAVATMGCSQAPERACTPGRSEACIGTGGCAGAQVCNADGLSFGACDCGTPLSDSDAGTDAGTDAGADAGTEPCNILTQTGCPSGQRCAFVRATADLGEPQCVAQGTVTNGGACTAPATGADDCQGAAGCLGSVCTPLCDPAAPACATNNTCQVFSGFTTPEGQLQIGGCVPKCDPVTQVRLTDNAPACGSPDPANPTIGCYGAPGMAFTCAKAKTTLTHGQVVNASGEPVYLNSCAPGYSPLLLARTGSTDVICIAYCSPGETYKGMNQNAGGIAPHTCAARGATSAECRFWHMAEQSESLTEYSNTVGFCFDYPNYTWDDDSNPSTPAVPSPSCTTLSSSDTNADGTADHVYWGCGPLPAP